MRPRWTAPAPAIIGVGELILDHVWDTVGPARSGRAGPAEPEDAFVAGHLHSTRGGGTVFNVLATLAQLGWAATAAGSAGSDHAGKFALRDLDHVGVDTTAMRAAPQRRTRLIFEMLGVDDATQVGGAAHSFTTKCPVCSQRISDASRPVVRPSPEPAVAPGTWAVYDQLTTSRVIHAQAARAAGAQTVLDLGAVGYLRYQPTAKILANLREFDLVFLNGKVAASLARRTRTSEERLSDYLPGATLVLTQGPSGALVTAERGKRYRVAAPPTARLVDDSGAGDALCAWTLNYLHQLATGHSSAGVTSAAVSAPSGAVNTEMVAQAAALAEEHVATVLERVGARGHLPPAPRDVHYDDLRGRTGTELRRATRQAGQCALCDLPLNDDHELRATARASAVVARASDIPLPSPGGPGQGAVPDPRSSRGLRVGNRPGQATPLASESAASRSDLRTPRGTEDAITHDYFSTPMLGAQPESPMALPPHPVRRSKPGARRNASLLLDRMLAAAEHPEAVGRAADILNGPPTRTLIVGSGGSLPAATYIAHVLNSRGHFAASTTPGEYLSAPPEVDLVIIVSYSGSTRDLAGVASIAKRKSTTRIALLTGSRNPALARELRPITGDLLISYAPPERNSGLVRASGVRESGFVSIAGTVAPCVPWLAAAEGLRSVVDLVHRLGPTTASASEAAATLASQAASSGRLHVVYGPGGRAAAVDVESKFTESGLPTVSIHEQKDLSHGRFMTVFRPAFGTAELAPVLLLSAGPATRYQLALRRALAETGVPHAVVESSGRDLAAPLELLTAVQGFSQQAGAFLGTDISRPATIPAAGLRLYKWRGPLP